ncbi:histidine phosphatase family protein [Rhodobacteraceae bacterium D3-12]|nr:histidine phosphatase family protein [Rhodobacteraceae bacterium D3-12]
MTGSELPATSFCLIRHGETTANAQSIIAGVTDVALTERGRTQARALAQLTWPDQLAIFTSPMARARETARLGFPGRDMQHHAGLRERDWGVYEGAPISDSPVREATPERGESWPGMLARVHRAICEICIQSGGRLPVLVCHSGVIRAARVLWTSGHVGERPANAMPILFLKTNDKLMEQSYENSGFDALRGV